MLKLTIAPNFAKEKPQGINSRRIVTYRKSLNIEIIEISKQNAIQN